MQRAMARRRRRHAGGLGKVLFGLLCFATLASAALVSIFPGTRDFINEKAQIMADEARHSVTSMVAVAAGGGVDGAGGEAAYGAGPGEGAQAVAAAGSADDTAPQAYPDRYRKFRKCAYMRNGSDLLHNLLLDSTSIYIAQHPYARHQHAAELVGKEERPDSPPPEYRAYQDMYPEMYATLPDEWKIRDKAVYLTFDDGPTIYTEKVLDTLREKKVKATFFVVGASIVKQGEDGIRLLNRMADEGHTIAIHCNVHDYKQVYASVEAYLTDFNNVYTKIHEVTGIRADIYRFPGGSVNKFNKAVRDELFAEMDRRGFTYYDWNASSGDSSSKITPEAAFWNATSKAGKASRIILLMHDTKKASVDALADIIDRYAELGYTFMPLSNEEKPIKL
jgi:peptidoglycan/xylan/chitin deacetylase (PgdA/CDA1 family)